MKKLLILSCLLFVGCVKKGDKGDNGIQGLRGPGDIEILSGAIPSNDFNVFDSRFGSAKEINVYILSGGQLVQMPIFIPLAGTNAYYITSANKTEIFNGSLAGGASYTIVMIL